MGFDTELTFSKPEDVKKSEVKPDYIYNNIRSLYNKLKK